MSQVKNFHIFIEGRVQGVGFRHFTHKKAQARGLKGWVRNLLDGRVEVQVTGPQNELELFLKELAQGPAFSSVRAVNSVETEVKMTQEFSVREDEALITNATNATNK